jgi:hypothetical protein
MRNTLIRDKYDIQLRQLTIHEIAYVINIISNLLKFCVEKVIVYRMAEGEMDMIAIKLPMPANAPKT